MVEGKDKSNESFGDTIGDERHRLNLPQRTCSEGIVQTERGPRPEVTPETRAYIEK